MNADPNNLSEARLIALLLMLLQWAVLWSMRYLSVPIKNPLVKFVALVIVSTATGGGFLVEVLLYRSITGFNGLRSDSLFEAMLISDMTICAIILFINAFEWRRRNSLG